MEVVINSMYTAVATTVMDSATVEEIGTILVTGVEILATYSNPCLANSARRIMGVLSTYHIPTKQKYSTILITFGHMVTP